ncbi:putative spermidine/putrescine transport system permease protein [Tranquillimonas rosea]|uniref:Putative spermidine/putrescine transport system permease protein n=1 Tax=Tranquillimonas rosea TaxID=641238 RepID=A0A1H9WJQ7_9RHOB|nr:ABC transporter permease [Tranquillimonas rosea]SES34128.1 putative spermidine/putrescine transport system permease protein [Tranquillimonas rosea]
MADGGRPRSFYVLAAVFTLFILFLYGPMLAIVVLSFQGPDGGLVFPMRGWSLHWFRTLWSDGGSVDISTAFFRSLRLALVVMVLTVVISVMAGLAFRRRFPGAMLLLYVAIASLIMPSIVVSLGIGLEFRLIDEAVKAFGMATGMESIQRNFVTALGTFTSGLGAHLTWTLPFGLLIMFAVFNRFDPSYEEAARDLGASRWQTFVHVTLPIIAPFLIGVAVFGFTLSWDELARSSQVMGSDNTLPMQLAALTTTVTTPEIYALGTTTTAASLLAVGVLLTVAFVIRRSRNQR